MFISLLSFFKYCFSIRSIFHLCFWNHLNTNQLYFHFLESYRVSPKFLVKTNPHLMKCMLFTIYKILHQDWYWVYMLRFKIANVISKLRNTYIFQNSKCSYFKHLPISFAVFFLSIKPQVLTSGRSVSPATSFETFFTLQKSSLYPEN